MPKAAGRHKQQALTAVAVRNLRTPGFYGDGNGLYLKVEATGAKRWVQRIVIQGKRRDIGLGSVELVSLSDAREAAQANRKLARSGGDPLAARRHAATIKTFKEAAKEVHDLRKPLWRNEKHTKQWMNSLRQHVFPTFGDKLASEVTSDDVLTALSKIWTSHPDTARRVRQRIGAIMLYAIAKHWRDDNPLDRLEGALPDHDPDDIEHYPAIPHHKASEALVKILATRAMFSTKLCLEFTILTATRSGEARGAEWPEIDLERAEWIIPAWRMKGKKAHRVPLSPRAVEILREAESLRRDGEGYIFPGMKRGRPLSDVTITKLLKENEIEAVLHGFRSTFRDWAGEMTDFPREVVEAALAHKVKDKTEAAYARSDLFVKRRLLMDAWAEYLAAKPAKVVRIA